MGDGNDDLSQLIPGEDYARTMKALDGVITGDTGPTMEALARDYPGISQDLAAAIIVSDVDVRYEGMGEIIRRDMHAQSWPQKILGSIGWVSRPVMTGIEDLWDSSLPMPLRFPVNVYQDLIVARNGWL